MSIYVNGVQHDWESVTVTGPQGTMLGIVEISFKSGQTKENLYGKGGVPQGVGRKNYEPEGSLTLLMSEYLRYRDALGGPIYRKRHDITITIEPPDAQSTTTELRDCYVNDKDVSVSQGDEKVEVKLSLRVGMISRDGQDEYD